MDKHMLQVPIGELVKVARESPEVQATIGWTVLQLAGKSRIATLGDLLELIIAAEEPCPMCGKKFTMTEGSDGIHCLSCTKYGMRMT